MALNIQRFHTITTVQSGADAFVQASLATDIVPEDGLIQRITSIHMQFRGNFSALAADTWIEWSLSRESEVAVLTLGDEQCIVADNWDFALVTSGAAQFTQTQRYENLSGLYIVEPTIYLQLDSVGLGAANTSSMRIYYEEVRASEVDILRILNNA